MKKYAKPYVKHEIKHFISLRVRGSKGNDCIGMELFNAYKEWCREFNTLPMSKNKLYANLEKRYKKIKSNRHGIVFLDVKLR